MSGDMRELRHLCGHSQPDFGKCVGVAPSMSHSLHWDHRPVETQRGDTTGRHKRETQRGDKGEKERGEQKEKTK